MYQDRSALMGDAVTMTDEDVLTIHRVSSAMTCCLVILLIALQEEHTTAIAHIDAFRIEIGSIDSLTTAYGYPIGAFAALTAVIPRYEEVIPAVVLEDEWCLDGIRTSKIRGGILRRIGFTGSAALASGSLRL